MNEYQFQNLVISSRQEKNKFVEYCILKRKEILLLKDLAIKQQSIYEKELIKEGKQLGLKIDICITHNYPFINKCPICDKYE